MSFSTVYHTDALIPAALDLEERKRAKNRAAQRKYRKKLQGSKQEPAGESREESVHTDLSLSRQVTWPNSSPTPYREHSNIHPGGRGFDPEPRGADLDLFPPSSWDLGPLQWDGFLDYSSNSSAYTSIGPQTPGSSASPGETASSISPRTSGVKSPISPQHELYPSSPPYLCSEEPLSQPDDPPTQRRARPPPPFTSHSHHQVSSPLSRIFSETAGIAGGHSHRHVANSNRVERPGCRPLSESRTSISDSVRTEDLPSAPRNKTSSKTHDQQNYKDTARIKQRTHLCKAAEKAVDKFSQIYDLAVGLDLCARDPEFKRTLQGTKWRFMELLSVNGEIDGDFDLE